jgi:hypothetical protein
MSTHGPFDTGYIGAHRWHVDGLLSYRWTCVCGDHGNVAGNLAFMYEAFGRHAHESLEKAAVGLLMAPLPNTRDVEARLIRRAEEAREAGLTDKANLLMMVANECNHEREQANEARFRGLEWSPWPEESSEGLSCAHEGYWLYAHPSALMWTWETWLAEHEGFDEESLAQGFSHTQAEAQRAAWDALMTYQEEQEAEPF